MVCLTYKYKTKFSTGSCWLKSKDGRDQTKQKMYTWSVSWNLFLQNDMLNVEWASPFSSGRHYFPDVSSQGIITVSLQTWSPIPPSCRHSVLSSPVRGRLAFHLPFVTLTLGSSHPALSAWSNPPIQRLCQMIRHNGWITCFYFLSGALRKRTLLAGEELHHKLHLEISVSLGNLVLMTCAIWVQWRLHGRATDGPNIDCLCRTRLFSSHAFTPLQSSFIEFVRFVFKINFNLSFHKHLEKMETIYSIVWVLVPFDLMGFWWRDTKQLPMLQDLVSLHLAF